MLKVLTISYRSDVMKEFIKSILYVIIVGYSCVWLPILLICAIIGLIYAIKKKKSLF